MNEFQLAIENSKRVQRVWFSRAALVSMLAAAIGFSNSEFAIYIGSGLLALSVTMVFVGIRSGWKAIQLNQKKSEK